MYTGSSGNGWVVILPKIMNTYCCYAVADPTVLSSVAVGTLAISTYTPDFPFTSGPSTMLWAIP